MQWKLTDFILLGEIWKENNRKENKIRLAHWAGIIRRMVINVKLHWTTVSMGLTVNRHMGRKLTVNRQKRNIFTVNRQMSEPKLTVKFLRYP